MSITVNTNMQALRIQANLTTATNKMNIAMERMSSGSRINKASDDAAGYAVSTKLTARISCSKVASDNTQMGQDLLASAEGSLDVIQSNLSRIRELVEQASNGTYSTDDLSGIAAEVSARMSQIDSLSTSASFNGKKLLDGSSSTGITLQVGTQSTDTLQLSGDIFARVSTSSLSISGLSGVITGGDVSEISAYLATLDSAINTVTNRITAIGAASNRLDAVAESLEVQQTNLSSALSTIKDADVAEESASYVQQQILQSASASLLVQANSAPQIALELIKG